MQLSERDEDLAFTAQAVELSRKSLSNSEKTPFGALVVLDSAVIGEGTSSVIELSDPTAHAEIMALRDAAGRRGDHILEGAVMYCSSEPCPMCLVACYWAKIDRIVFGASSVDVGRWGFEDAWFYREVALPPSSRRTRQYSVGGDVERDAVSVLREWGDALDVPIVPKL